MASSLANLLLGQVLSVLNRLLDVWANSLDVGLKDRDIRDRAVLLVGILVVNGRTLLNSSGGHGARHLKEVEVGRGVKEGERGEEAQSRARGVIL